MAACDVPHCMMGRRDNEGGTDMEGVACVHCWMMTRGFHPNAEVAVLCISACLLVSAGGRTPVDHAKSGCVISVPVAAEKFTAAFAQCTPVHVQRRRKISVICEGHAKPLDLGFHQFLRARHRPHLRPHQTNRIQLLPSHKLNWNVQNLNAWRQPGCPLQHPPAWQI